MPINKTDTDVLYQPLLSMTRERQTTRVVKGRYKQRPKTKGDPSPDTESDMDVIQGRVIGHRNGYGFLSPDGGGRDLYLSPYQMRSLIHGDRALVRMLANRNGRREATLVEVLERAHTHIVGRCVVQRGVKLVVADDQRIQHRIVIDPDTDKQANAGDVVIAELLVQPTVRDQPRARITKVLGCHSTPALKSEIALHTHGVPGHWPHSIGAEIEELDRCIPDAIKQDRCDLRHLPLVTIDAEDARDFDDAISCKATTNGWKLVVAIADVSAYVVPGTALDDEARNRGNSVYFPDRVIPMLPEMLANELCSLMPERDRLCFVCEMIISTDGQISRSRFFSGWMRSHARLSYNQVTAILAGDSDRRMEPAQEPILFQLPDSLRLQLQELHALYHALSSARKRRGALDMDTVETRIVLDVDHKVSHIEPVVRNDAHRIVEECMIAANVCAARFLARHRIPALYRVHQGPTEITLGDLRVFLAELGLSLGGENKPQPADYAQLLRQVVDHPAESLIQTVLLRSLSKAVYKPQNTGHFGLAHDCYTHFTSPIRRYADLLVHRGIKHALAGGGRNSFAYSADDLVPIGEHVSTTERRADDASRDVSQRFKCEYMSQYIGDIFSGTITGVTSFGIFVTLDSIFVEGLVHIGALGPDFFHFDPARHRLIGDRTRRIYRLADSIRVRVADVNQEERRIVFEPMDGRSSKRLSSASHRSQ